MKRKMTLNEQIAMWITTKSGTMPMFYCLVGWYIGWVVTNVALGPRAFDPFPFIFLMFLSSALQLWWLPVLSVGQNVIAVEDRRRSEENDLIIRNQLVTMKAVYALLETDVGLAKDSMAMAKDTESRLRQLEDLGKAIMTYLVPQDKDSGTAV